MFAESSFPFALPKLPCDLYNRSQYENLLQPVRSCSSYCRRYMRDQRTCHGLRRNRKEIQSRNQQVLGTFYLPYHPSLRGGRQPDEAIPEYAERLLRRKDKSAARNDRALGIIRQPFSKNWSFHRYDQKNHRQPDPPGLYRLLR